MKTALIQMVFLLAVCPAIMGSEGKFEVESNSLKLIDKGERTEFIGDVVMTRGKMRIKSDKVISSKKTDLLEASGKVEMNYSSDTVKVSSRCRRLTVDQGTRKIRLFDDVKARITETLPEEVRAADVVSSGLEVDYAGTDIEAYFNGDVKMTSEEIEVNSEKAVYSKKAGTVVFSGAPSARTYNDKHQAGYSGEIMSVSVSEMSFSIKGNATARIRVYGTKM